MNDYFSQFQKDAIQTASAFCNNILVEEIASFLIDYLVRSVNNVDRNSDKEIINVDFGFEVEKSRIVLLGYYNTFWDFEKHRYKPINTDIEQAAIAYAISNKLKNQFQSQYPKDISGTTYNLTISQKYKGNKVIQIITYSCKNGYYICTRDWR